MATEAKRAAGSRATLTWLALAFLTLGSVGDLGTAPAMAVFGLASVSLYVLPAIVFLVPAALVSAELASGWQGGLPGARARIDLRRGGGRIVVASLIGLLPPSQLGHANVPLYALDLLAGVLVVGVLPPVLLLRLRRPDWKTG